MDAKESLRLWFGCGDDSNACGKRVASFTIHSGSFLAACSRSFISATTGRLAGPIKDLKRSIYLCASGYPSGLTIGQKTMVYLLYHYATRPGTRMLFVNPQHRNLEPQHGTGVLALALVREEQRDKGWK
jgi:hypothetical protein